MAPPPRVITGQRVNRGKKLPPSVSLTLFIERHAHNRRRRGRRASIIHQRSAVWTTLTFKYSMALSLFFSLTLPPPVHINTHTHTHTEAAHLPHISSSLCWDQRGDAGAVGFSPSLHQSASFSRRIHVRPCSFHSLNYSHLGHYSDRSFTIHPPHPEEPIRARQVVCKSIGGGGGGGGGAFPGFPPQRSESA